MWFSGGINDGQDRGKVDQPFDVGPAARKQLNHEVCFQTLDQRPTLSYELHPRDIQWYQQTPLSSLYVGEISPVKVSSVLLFCFSVSKVTFAAYESPNVNMHIDTENVLRTVWTTTSIESSIAEL